VFHNIINIAVITLQILLMQCATVFHVSCTIHVLDSIACYNPANSCYMIINNFNFNLDVRLVGNSLLLPMASVKQPVHKMHCICNTWSSKIVVIISIVIKTTWLWYDWTGLMASVKQPVHKMHCICNTWSSKIVVIISIVRSIIMTTWLWYDWIELSKV